MKRAFTLIEMMIVVAIIAVLMTITFRLTGAGDNDKKRISTIVTMQKIENCLSGYYAAFGSYPPVALHGSRDIYLKVSGGDQTSERNEGAFSDEAVASQIQAACRAQPFGCEYPPSPDEKKAIEYWAWGPEDPYTGPSMKDRTTGGKYLHYPSFQYAFAFQGDLTEPDLGEGFNNARPNLGGEEVEESEKLRTWQQVKLFKFGVMSFLLPRYLFMLRSDQDWFSPGRVCYQWDDSNEMPSDALEGKSFSDLREAKKIGGDADSGWEVVRSWAGGNEEGSSSKTESSTDKFNRMRVANIPSQAVCARWMPNLEKACFTTLAAETFFGINVSAGSWMAKASKFTTELGNPYAIIPPKSYFPIHRAPSRNDSGTPYCLGMITIQDGWDQEFFYYSLPPYQSYTLWSAGPDGKTFPPWISLDEIEDEDDCKTAAKWKADDIVHMSN